MMNLTLYRREMKGSIRLFIILAAVLAMYISIIISMYDPEMTKLLDSYVEMMPQLMSAVGMSAGASTLIGFMSSYLYGFILLIFPMLFCILRGHSLVCKYMDKGSMAALVAAPVRRSTIAFTQMMVLVSGILLLVAYSTILEIGCAYYYFPGELDTGELLSLNGGLLCLQLFIGGVCFLASCIFSESRYSIGFGAGIPIFMYVLQMLANTGGKAENAKYFTFFTLFDPGRIIAGHKEALTGSMILLAGAILLYSLGIVIFSKKDLHI